MHNKSSIELLSLKIATIEAKSPQPEARGRGLVADSVEQIFINGFQFTLQKKLKNIQ
jgi:hypothetical protein